MIYARWRWSLTSPYVVFDGDVLFVSILFTFCQTWSYKWNKKNLLINKIFHSLAFLVNIFCIKQLERRTQCLCQIYKSKQNKELSSTLFHKKSWSSVNFWNCYLLFNYKMSSIRSMSRLCLIGLRSSPKLTSSVSAPLASRTMPMMQNILPVRTLASRGTHVDLNLLIVA